MDRIVANYIKLLKVIFGSSSDEKLLDRWARFAIFHQVETNLTYRIQERLLWYVGNILLSAQLLIYVGIALGVFGGELGLTDLFWNESWWSQLLVGLSTCWFFGVTIYVNMLLRGLRSDYLPNEPNEHWTRDSYRSLFPSLNPGVKKVGKWIFRYLSILGVIIYGGKLAAFLYNSAVYPKMKFLEQWADLPYGGGFFLIGYLLGFALAYVYFLLDALYSISEELTSPGPPIGGVALLAVGGPHPADGGAPPADGGGPPPPALGGGAPPCPPPLPPNQQKTVKLLHSIAVSIGFILMVLLGAILLYAAVVGGKVLTPVVVMSLILMVANVFGGFIAFRLRFGATIGLIFILYIIITNSLDIVGYKMSFPFINDSMYEQGQELEIGGPGNYQNNFQTQQPDGKLIDSKEWLEKLEAKWREKHKDNSKPPLVLIATSGGGIRAAVWTGVVLQELDGLVVPDGDRTLLRNHIRLVAGASGGMVGATAYAGSFARGKPDDKEPLLDDNFDRELGLYPLGKALAEDSLSSVFQTTLLHDFTLSVVLPKPSKQDRGRALEAAWDENFSHANIHGGTPFAIPIRRVKDDEEQFRRPAMVFSPVLVEDSKRLIISNLDFGWLSKPEIYLLDKKMVDQISLPAVEFFRLFPNANEFKIGTAARMSASFPVISPAVSLPVKPVRRVVDAGYFDNYGVDLLSHWLLRHRDDIEKHTSGALLIQIRAYPLDTDGKNLNNVEESPIDTILGAVSGPLQAVLTVRGMGAHQRNSTLVDVVNNTFKAGDKKAADGQIQSPFFGTVVFELDGEAALSWYMTAPQKRLVAEGMYQYDPGKRTSFDFDYETNRPKLRKNTQQKKEQIASWFRNRSEIQYPPKK